MSADIEELAAALAARLPGAAARPATRVHGGCIGDCLRWPVGDGWAFVKLAPASSARMLEAEVRGLDELAAAGAVRTPRVLAQGTAGGSAYLALEWIDFGPGSPAADQRLGEQLAFLHRQHAPRFGFESDNFIGSNPQPNLWCDDWVTFLRERRLGFQLDLAAGNGRLGRVQDRGRRLLEVMDVFFSSYTPAPSLLHGDLWGGNRAVALSGEPVIYDPAVYYGDREADLAMTRLFGGFGARFYAAYVAAWPLDPASGIRRDLYNLYHVLNHVNLFGGGYDKQALGMIDRLLAAAGH